MLVLIKNVVTGSDKLLQQQSLMDWFIYNCLLPRVGEIERATLIVATGVLPFEDCHWLLITTNDDWTDYLNETYGIPPQNIIGKSTFEISIHVANISQTLYIQISALATSSASGHYTNIIHWQQNLHTKTIKSEKTHKLTSKIHH